MDAAPARYAKGERGDQEQQADQANWHEEEGGNRVKVLVGVRSRPDTMSSRTVTHSGMYQEGSST